MQSITLRKQVGASYRRYDLKNYEVLREGKVIGTIGHDFSMKWEVSDLDFKPLSTHTTIKAAARVAARVL